MQEARIFSIDPDEVLVEDRLRYVYRKEAMEQLKESIKDKGQLQPGVCRMEAGNVILIAGERRRQACKLAGVAFDYTLKDETDPLRLLEIEIEENSCREDLTWQEQVEATERHHQILQSIKGEASVGRPGGHRVKDTAEFRGESVGKTAEDLELARFLDVDEVKKAPNKAEAKKVIKKLKENYQRHEAFEKAKEKSGLTLPPRQEEVGEDGEVEEISPLEERIAFFYDKIIQGRMEDVLSKTDKEFDVVLFDPPWAVDYDKVRKGSSSQEDFEDDPFEVLDYFPKWLSLLYNKMAENSHLYLFFGISRYDLVYAMLEDAGFSTNRIPLIWYKQGAHRTRNPDIWPGRSYEPIAYARKGSKILVQKGASDVIISPMPWASLKGIHPAAKHPDVYIDLLKRSCMPGDKVLDPMCGSGMAGVAAEVLRPTHELDWLMIEEKESFRDLAIANVVRGYSNLIQTSKTEPKEVEEPKYHSSFETPTDYKVLTPGTDLWRIFWNNHPEMQEEMLEWKKEHSNETNRQDRT